jgi:aspartate aminotransferase-like enzyme
MTRKLRFDIDQKINLHTGAMLAPNIARALALPMMSAHGDEFLEIYHETRRMLQEVMGTRATVLITMGTTTAALDTAIASVVEPGTKVLVVVNGRGVFSERLLRMVEHYGGEAVVVRSPAERPIRVEEVEAALDRQGPVEVMVVPHVESTYGTANPIDELGRVARRQGALYLVDAAPTVGGTDYRMDEWGIDLTVTSSFKALGGTMGTPIIAANRRVWARLEARKSRPATYHDLTYWRRYFVDAEGRSIDGDPAPSMAVNNVCALHEGVAMILEWGRERVFRMHRVAAQATRAGVRAMGLELFPRCEDGRGLSDALTVVRYPAGVEERRFRWEVLAGKYDVIVSGGLGELRGRVFRIGHMGIAQVLPRVVLTAVAAIEAAMWELGVDVRRGEGVKAAQEVLAEL